ncbi:hypothetical protein C900_05796 [Fulvivirga imtechensis AK7]|uniref:F5/8 type C domain-containing protein n=1 Tax=Fulvivirga imtechensis AK7 TaxID=1237149 RepID=L8JKQ1_9BACT|nr:discoidin domain-containing protein [Fulvivirga imtechensis]ELR68783.1 hypothetical protein C900_05796 [Fulvivirga imtechensis AK7]
MMKKVLRIGLSAAIVFLLLEILLRISYSNKLQTQIFPLIYKSDPVLGYSYIADISGEIRRPGFNKNFKINRHGFPGRDFSIKKPIDTYRILFVGASEVTGLFTDGADGYVSLLQKKFDNYPEKVEVINCAVDGAARHYMNHQNIKQNLVHYDPNLILIERLPFPFMSFGHRTIYKDYVIDYTDEGDLEKIKEHIDKEFYGFNLFKLTYDLLYSYRYFCKLYVQADMPLIEKIGPWLAPDKLKVDQYITKRIFYKDKRPTTSVNTSIDSLMSLKNFLDERKIEFAFYSTYNSSNDLLLSELFKELDIKNINLDITRKEQHHCQEDAHSSAYGHQAIASKFYPILSEFIDSAQRKNWVKLKSTTKKSPGWFTTLKDTLTFNLYQQPRADRHKVLILSGSMDLFEEGRQFELDFSSNLKKLSRERNSKLDISFSFSLNRNNSFEYIRHILKQIYHHQPNTVLFEEPASEIIIADSGFYEAMQLIKEHCQSLNINSYFFNYESTRESKIIYHLLKNTTIDHLSSGIEINAKEYSQVPDDPNEILKVTSSLVAERIYTSLQDRIVDESFFSPIKNVALHKPTYTSSSIDQPGWGSNKVVDGLRTSYWQSRGYMSSGPANFENSQWLLVDLLDKYELEQLIIFPAKERSFLTSQPNFTVTTSLDSLTFTPTKRGWLEQNNALFIDMEKRLVRYVKVEANELEPTPLAFSEIEILGIEVPIAD